MGNQDVTSRSAIASEKQAEVAVLAGGCFWGVEEILREVPGVIDTEVGYTGGWLENPTYADTHHSKSGHAEAIRVTFDPAVLSYEDLLEKWFFKLHDPTTLNRQGYDVGTRRRYRPANCFIEFRLVFNLAAKQVVILIYQLVAYG
jgi:peptide-methionine (S)-S-oxide reductase